MSSDGTTEERRASVGVLPALKPVVVVGDEDVDALIQSARASIAKLSLELRALQHEAAVAEQGSGVLDSTTDELDMPGARDILRIGVETRLAARRSELLAQVEEAHAAAARRLLAAQTEAAALVDAARDELVQVLSDATDAARSEGLRGNVASVPGGHGEVVPPPTAISQPPTTERQS